MSDIPAVRLFCEAWKPRGPDAWPVMDRFKLKKGLVTRCVDYFGMAPLAAMIAR